MDPLIEKLKALLGDAWKDEWRDELKPVVEEVTGSAVSAAVASGVDGEKAKRLKADTALKASAVKVKELEEQLASAGDTDAALVAARSATAEMQTERDTLKGQLRGRDISDAARKALAGSKLEDDAAIPAERLGAALRLLPLDGVDLDEAGAVVGLEASVTALHEAEPWLWAKPEQGGGHGGKRGGSGPPPKAPPPKDDDQPWGGKLAEIAYASRSGTA